MKEYLYIVRPKNLFIVGISQALIYFVFLIPFFETNNATSILSSYLWIVFILDTLLIAAAGYVINDILDYRIDKINKPKKLYISDHNLTRKKAWIYYALLVGAGFLIATFIALEIDKLHLLIIYPLACFLLFMYSYQWKGQYLIGNLIVALFCAFVPGIIWFAEYDVINGLDSMTKSTVEGTFTAYIAFGILATMAREIIKDIEDIEGDHKNGLHTLPIVSGTRVSKSIVVLLFCVLLFTYWYFWLPLVVESDFLLLLLVVLLVAPTLFLIYLTQIAKNKKDYGWISTIIKVLMVASLILFLSLPMIYF